jgi:benzoyl-CoA 2,3-dioxygenase component B
MFTYFTDRDGRFQLKSLAESAFDPLSRTCRFMLTEEAFHMFVGASGITRIVKRSLEVMRALGSDDPAMVRDAGAVDLPTLQRYVNFWFSSSLDLFGAEISSNAAGYFAAGLKGRPDEAQFTDHLAVNQRFQVEMPARQGEVMTEEVPMRSAMNEVTRAAYIRDCSIGLERWNRLIRGAGYDFRLVLPSPRFHRATGVWAGVATNPGGRPITEQEWQLGQRDWLPSAEDRAFISSLMQRVTEPGKVAGWIAPPEIGINNAPLDYKYVRLN